MRRLVANFTLVLLSVEARANDPDADVRSVIDRGICFLRTTIKTPWSIRFRMQNRQRGTLRTHRHAVNSPDAKMTPSPPSITRSPRTSTKTMPLRADT